MIAEGSWDSRGSVAGATRPERTVNPNRGNAMPAIAELLAGYPVVIQLPVVWGEMDSYRHVNNVVYFRYLESARLEYCARLDSIPFVK